MKFKIRYRKTKLVTAVGLSVGLGWCMGKIYKTQETLRNAFDSSIIEIYEPHISKSAIEYVSSNNNYTPEWIQPEYAQLLFNKGSNFFKFMYARRLLSIAQCDNVSLRVRAVNQLSKLELDNWQYSLIAHMCDARTAVGLARTPGTKERFFLTPPRKYGTYNNRLLLHAINDYLKKLYKTNGHLCVEKTISKMFSEAHDVGRIIDVDHGAEDVRSLTKENNDMIPICLETIRHHSLIPAYANDIVMFNGLGLLMEVYKRFNENSIICIQLCNILANISINKDVLEDIYKAGWVSVLAKWANHPDIRISGPAVQALANLDQDDFEDKFSTNIYLLYPKHRSTEKKAVDVIFIHGLLGNVFYTWRTSEKMEAYLALIGKQQKEEEGIGLNAHEQETFVHSSDPAVQEYFNELTEQTQSEWDSVGHDFEFVYYDIPESTNEEASGPYTFTKSEKSVDSKQKVTQCWPKDWLPQDCSHLRILGVNYDTNISVWVQNCPQIPHDQTLDDRSSLLIESLVKAGVGKRPIVWITHSMGGLITKNLLAMVKDSKNPEMRQICENTKAIFFYSTPHSGSKTATLNQTTSYVIWPSMEVTELREGSEILKRIHENFLKVLIDVPIKVYSFVETKSTLVSALKLNFMLVEPSSGNPGVGECFEIPLNHLGICKPCNRESFLYQKVLDVVRGIVKESQS